MGGASAPRRRPAASRRRCTSGTLSSADLVHLEGALRVVLAPSELGETRAWGDALCETLAPLVPDGMASLLRITPAGPFTHTGPPLEDQVAYVRHYARLDVAATHQTARRQEIAHRWSLVSREACRRTEFYEAFLRPRRLEDAYWLNTFGADGALHHRVFLNFRRELSDPERERVTTVLRLLAPAFRAGTAMHDRPGGGSAPLLRAVDALPQGLQLLDLRGRGRSCGRRRSASRRGCCSRGPRACGSRRSAPPCRRGATRRAAPTSRRSACTG